MFPNLEDKGVILFQEGLEFSEEKVANSSQGGVAGNHRPLYAREGSWRWIAQPGRAGSL